jgi:hypothetical protein
MKAAVGHEARAGHQRLVRLAILLTPRHAQRAHGLAVVSPFGAHKSGAAGGGASHLESGLHRFRTAIGEECVLQTFRSDFRQATRQRPLHGVEERLAAQRLLVQLIHHRTEHVRVAMAEAKHTVAT